MQLRKSLASTCLLSQRRTRYVERPLTATFSPTSISHSDSGVTCYNFRKVNTNLRSIFKFRYPTKDLGSGKCPALETSDWRLVIMVLPTETPTGGASLSSLASWSPEIDNSNGTRIITLRNDNKLYNENSITNKNK